MSRLNYESVVEMLEEAISAKNKSINLEVDLISRSGDAEDIIDRAHYLSKLISSRDALLTFLRDVQNEDEGV